MRLPVWLRIAIVGLVVLAAGIGGALIERRHWQERLRRFSATSVAYAGLRGAVLLDQAEQMPRGAVLVLGDSIVDRQRLGSLCGRPVLNAGISGIDTARLAAIAPRLIAAANPAIVVIAVGVNDTGRWSTDSLERWRRSYLALVGLAREGT